MREPSPDLVEQIQDVLASDFGPRDLLQFATDRLAFDDVKIAETVNFGRGRSGIAFEMVQVARQYHHLDDLVVALRDAAPNERTRSLLVALGLSPPDTRRAVVGESLTGVQAANLHRFVVESYRSIEDLEATLERVGYSHARRGRWIAGANNDKNFRDLIADAAASGWDRLLAFCTIYGRWVLPASRACARAVLARHEQAGLELLDGLINLRVEEGGLIDCYNRARGPWWVEPGLPPGARQSLISVAYAVVAAQDAASGGPDDDDRRPLLRFLQHLIRLPTLEEGDRQGLVSVWQSLAARLGLAGRLEGGAPPDPAHYWVAIELRDSVEATPRRPCWSRRAWLCRSGTFERLDDHLPEGIETPDTVPAYLNALRDRLAERNIGPQAVVFEVFLQRRSLSQAVDQWPLDVDGIPVELGYVNPVVIRSGDRKQTLDKLRERWETLASSACLDVRGAVARRSTGGNPTALFKEFLQNPALQCLLLEAPVAVGTDVGEFPCIQAAIAAGLPVILWARDEAAVESLGRELSNWAAGPPRDLPGVIHTLRQNEPADAAAPLGRHLTLLFENGRHRLPENRLAAEAR